MSGHMDHYINNTWVPGAGQSFASRNPANEEIIWQGSGANEQQVAAAVSAARTAFPGWCWLQLDDRIEYLHRFRDALHAQSPLLAEVISKETGKPLWESKTEITAMANKVDVSIEAYKERTSETMREHPLGRSVRRHKPHGVVAIFGPFNFPGHLPNGHIVPALLAGNTVVLKPSELAPMTAEMIMRCWEQSGLPPGVINMIQGGRDTGRLLSTQEDIDGLFFTGSMATGVILLELFARHPEKILALEMGGNNPLVVWDPTDVTAAAYQTIQSAFITAGQRCSCARRLIVQEGKAGEAFIQELIRLMKGIKVGPYTDVPEPFMGPVISESAASYLLAAQGTLKTKGGIPLVMMKLLEVDTALLSPGLIDVTKIYSRSDDEIFGPLLQVIRVPNFEAAIHEANNTEFGLTAGLLGGNEELYKQFYQKTRAGVINWNTPLTGASSAAPFGGVGRSGNHRPSAFYAADYCAYPVASIEAKELMLPPSLTPGIDLKVNN